MNDTQLKHEPQAEDHCATCNKKDTACISFFAHENAMMHKEADNERAGHEKNRRAVSRTEKR